MSHRIVRIRAALGVAAAAALALAGCAASGDAPADGDGSVETINAGTMTVCTTDSPPNIVVNADGELEGVEIDIADALGEAIGLDVEYREYAFAGMIPALQAGQCDVILGSLYIKPEREEIADFVPYLLSGSAVGVGTGNPEGITGFDESLCGTRVVAITGATGALLAEQQSATCEEDGEESIDITLVDESTNALQQVQAGQVDAVIDTAELVAYYQSLSEDTLEIVGEPFGTIAIGAATLRGDDDALHAALEDAFEGMLEDGTYDAILEENDAQIGDIRASTE